MDFGKSWVGEERTLLGFNCEKMLHNSLNFNQFMAKHERKMTKNMNKVK